MTWPAALAPYRKTIAAIAGIALTYAVQRWGSNNNAVDIATAVAAVLGIYAVPNDTKFTALTASTTLTPVQGSLAGTKTLPPSAGGETGGPGG
jgi:hypothetical protein